MARTPLLAGKFELKVTELEASVLGLIATKGPCTPYAVRKEFLESPSPFWSGSAGAIYPLFARLARRGLVRVCRGTGDGRAGKLYVLTPVGRRVLYRWLREPLSSVAIGIPPDPLRNRVQFIGVLGDHEGRELLSDAVAKLDAHLHELVTCANQKKAEGKILEHIVNQGACHLTRARLDWLRETIDFLARSRD
jgi:DNA-binding PadR family transcriptional regulator